MAHPKRPDFSDAGYGQMGCPIMLVSVVAGVPLAVFVAWWLEIEAAPAGPVDVDAGYLLSVAVAALSGALAITLAAMWLINRLPALWASADRILLVIWLAAPAGLVLAVLLTAPGRALLTPLLALTGVLVAWMVVDLVRDVARARRSG
jgi:hypothetical protein